MARVASVRARSGARLIADTVAVVVARPDLSLSEWAVLGVVAERPTHGWPVVQELAPDGALGRIWTVSRPLVYRALSTLTAAGLVEECGEVPGARGPRRTIVRVTRAGRAALRSWLDEPVGHVREVRSALLVKLALRERAGRDSATLIDRQIDRLEPVFAAVTRRAGRSKPGPGFDAVLATWRREQALAVRRFLRSQASDS